MLSCSMLAGIFQTASQCHTKARSTRSCGKVLGAATKSTRLLICRVSFSALGTVEFALSWKSICRGTLLHIALDIQSSARLIKAPTALAVALHWTSQRTQRLNSWTIWWASYTSSSRNLYVHALIPVPPQTDYLSNQNHIILLSNFTCQMQWFHFGGDETDTRCWGPPPGTSPNITGDYPWNERVWQCKNLPFVL